MQPTWPLVNRRGLKIIHLYDRMILVLFLWATRMKLHLSFTLLACFSLAACTLESTDMPPPAPYIPVTPAQITRTELAPALYELAYSKRQNAVFVVSSGGWGDDAPPSYVFKLDPLTLAVQAQVELPLRGFGTVLDDATDTLYIGTQDAALIAFDTAKLEVRGSLQLSSEKVADERGGGERYVYNLRELLLDTANHRLYAPGLAFTGSVVFVVDTNTFTLEKTIPGLGAVATGVALDAEQGRVLVADFTGNITTIDTATLEIVNTWDSGADQPLNLALDVAGQRLFATDQGMPMVTGMQQQLIPGFQSRGPGHRVIVRHPEDGAVLGEFASGEGPIAILPDWPRQRLYVTHREAGTLGVFDARDYALLDTIELPVHPNSLALDADNDVLYVSIKNPMAISPEDMTKPESVARIDFKAAR